MVEEAWDVFLLGLRLGLRDRVRVMRDRVRVMC